jgi:hypothetical protein
MAFSNAIPRGEIQGEVAVVETRRLGLDGHSSVVEVTTHHTRHSLLAHAKLYFELAEQIDARSSAEVQSMRKHG